LTTLYLVGAKNTNNRRNRKGHLQLAFPLDFLMVPSSAIAITTDGERLTCGGFSLDETVCLRNFEFIIDYFSSLILSPRRGDEGVAFMGSTHSGVSNPRWAMIEDSTEEFLMASSEKEVSTSLTSEGATRGPCSLPPQPHHGWRTLRPHMPR
jgi:hypothetical protein